MVSHQNPFIFPHFFSTLVCIASKRRSVLLKVSGSFSCVPLIYRVVSLMLTMIFVWGGFSADVDVGSSMFLDTSKLWQAIVALRGAFLSVNCWIMFIFNGLLQIKHIDAIIFSLIYSGGYITLDRRQRQLSSRYCLLDMHLLPHQFALLLVIVAISIWEWPIRELADILFVSFLIVLPSIIFLVLV